MSDEKEAGSKMEAATEGETGDLIGSLSETGTLLMEEEDGMGTCS